jgi:hypothetical protein
MGERTTKFRRFFDFEGEMVGFFLRRLGPRAVAEDLYEGRWSRRPHCEWGSFRRRPKSAAALLDPPPFVAATYVMPASFLEFTLDLVRILEQAIQHLAEHFFLGPAEQPLGRPGSS